MIDSSFLHPQSLLVGMRILWPRGPVPASSLRTAPHVCFFGESGIGDCPLLPDWIPQPLPQRGACEEWGKGWIPLVSAPASWEGMHFFPYRLRVVTKPSCGFQCLPAFLLISFHEMTGVTASVY